MSSFRATRTALRAVARTSKPAARPATTPLSQSRTFASAHSSSAAGLLHQSRLPRATTHQHTPQAAAARRSPFAGRRGGVRTIFIQTEQTPNADAIKFLPNHRILPDNIATPFIEYLNPRSTIAPPYPSPLAAQLMNIDGVTSVFYGADFITVSKAADANWAHIRPEVFALITEAITSGQAIVNVSEKKEAGVAGASGEEQQQHGEEDSLAYDENDTEVVGMIKELLETRIRPAIQEDGGDIEFRGFTDEGVVLLKLRGACRTCDSSTVTLKNGIEGMLMHYIEEVKGVEQILDQEEEIAIQEFAKFEEKLKAQKGSEATAA
ncbi:thioredoxin-like protein [Colletotrichum tofieldiae]|uniref:Thioredoxin-like protein n=1 Tax=Colletotrichum tofieldiae TaxID=708197 RepID=A0A166LKW9_9PEZI|nr:Thioredoxin-like protein [Colletotrichum tofieldiae]GKT57351.1 Thioredoxin-like protein [Colletotrichum tofieldiae]GKT79079.1 thioredoxin-like protein [Colletotrichum tofieldiae]GKT86697.1 thioredoxin-like protein [Colletotrichum tofieldiae]